MPQQSVFYTDIFVSGTLTCTRFRAPDGSIDDDAIAAGTAGEFVAATKLEHQFGSSVQLADTTTLVTALTRQLHIVRGLTGEVVGLEAVVSTIPAVTTASHSIDLRKVTAASTGVSILSAVLTQVSTDVARTPAAAIISSADLADGDQLHVVVTTTGDSTSQARGLLLTLTLREDPS